MRPEADKLTLAIWLNSMAEPYCSPAESAYFDYGGRRGRWPSPGDFPDGPVRLKRLDGKPVSMCRHRSALQRHRNGAGNTERCQSVVCGRQPMSDSRVAVYAALMVVLYVHASSDIELTARETVRLDRLAYSEADGFVAERHGDLLEPGTTQVRLAEGVYHFRTAHDAQLRVADPDSVTVVAPSVNDDPKDPWPPSVSAVHAAAFGGRGAASPDRTPVLTVMYGEAR
jgi:hypothetical protein